MVATGGTIGAERTNRSVGLTWGIVAVVALIGLLIGGLVVGGWLRPAPDAVLPSSTAIPSPRAEATPSPSVPLGGGLILAYQPHESPGECNFDSLAPFDVLTVDPATGERTLLGTTAEDCSARWLNLQWAPDREHILMTDALGQEPMELDTPTAAGRAFTFICCDLPTDVWQGGANQSQGWVLSPAGDRVAAIHTGRDR